MLTASIAHGNLPQLSAQQHKKLLLLSLLPLSHSHKTLTYDSLRTALDLPTNRAIEDLVTTAVYSGLLSATLDPAHSRVSVASVAPLRDLAPGSLPSLQATLQTWSLRCDSALDDLEAQVREVKEKAVEREKDRRKRERALEAVIQHYDEKGAKRGQDDDAMEVDQEGGNGGGGRPARSSGRRTGGGGFYGGFGRRAGG
jgi:COP9 signalosome complex subunit 7